ncbi:hypothetical protein DSECCO2_75920 [anaerobic digester metagenome]
MKLGNPHITETKQSNTATELTDYFSSLAIAIDLQSDAAFVIDTNGIIQVWNKSLESITMVDRNQILGYKLEEVKKSLLYLDKPTLAELVLANKTSTHVGYPINQTDQNTFTCNLKYISSTKQETSYIVTASKLYLKNSLTGVIQIYKNPNTLLEEELLFDKIKTERLRIAKDLHDELGVLVSTQKIFLNLLKEELKSNQRCTEYIEHSLNISNQTISACSRLTSKLKSNSYQSNLVQALHSLSVLVNSTGMLVLDVDVDDAVGTVDENTQTALYKIVKELVNNTLKHSKARNAKITLNLDADKVNLFYADNGIGFNTQNRTNTVSTTGLTSISERLDSIGAKWQLKTEPQEGLQLNAQIVLSK